MEPTPYPELNRVLSQLQDGLTRVLGNDLVSLCLQGSFAVGGFDEHSDVDFVVGIRTELPDTTVEALQEMHGRIFDLSCPWAQHLEGSYLPIEVLRTCDRRGEKLWYLDNGARSLIQATHCNTAVVRQTVRQYGIRIAGPVPESLVDPIPVDLLRAEMLTTMCGWGEEILADPDQWRNRFYQGFITLNYCRMWCDITLGNVGSKQRGAEWAKARLDPEWADLIDRAWETRPIPEVSVRESPDPEDFERTLQLVRHLIDLATDSSPRGN